MSLRRHAGWLVASASLSAWNASEPSAQPAAPLVKAVVTVPASTSATRVWIGERVTVTVRAEHPALSESRLPRSPLLGDFELVALERLRPDEANGGCTDEWRLTVAAFQSGLRVLPSINVETVFDDGRRVVTRTNPVVLNIVEPPVTADTPLRPLAQALVAPARVPWRHLAVLSTIVAIIAGATVLLAYRVLRLGQRRRQRLIFWRALALEMTRVAAAASGEWPRTREAYTQLFRMLRRGTSRATALPLERMSRQGVTQQIASAGLAEKDLACEVEHALEGLDAIRFRGRQPDPQAHRDAVVDAKALLATIRRVARRHRR